MPRGIVKRYYPERGYGFITPANGGEVVFVHETEIRVAGEPVLREGQIVEYDVTPGDAYLLAVDVREVPN